MRHIVKQIVFTALLSVVAIQAAEKATNSATTGSVDAASCQVPKEIPFAEGETPPKPCKDFFWTLISKPAIFKTEVQKIKVADKTFYMKPIPAVYEWVEEKIETVPARRIPYCQPAKFEKKCIDVTVQEASKQYVNVPAVFSKEEKTITFRPAMEKEIYVPGEYRTVQRRIEVEPARDELCDVSAPKEMKLGRGEQIAGSIGSIEKPARYITVAVQELVKKPTTKKIKVPAITKKIVVHKLKKPATYKEVAVPAITKKIWVETCTAEERIRYRNMPPQFELIRRMVLKKPATKVRTEVPAKYQTIRKNSLVTPAKMLWRQYSISQCKAVADICGKYGSLPGSGAFF